MSDTVISVENLSKVYQLGVIGTGTFFGDLNRWWARQLGKPDPYAKIREKEKDHGNRIGETIHALRDVSFKVTQGEALGIIGRNGAGKSTMLKILSQVTAPTSGIIKTKGRIASLLEVGTGFHPELTGRENIYLNGAILGMSRAEVSRKFDEIVDFSGVEKFIDTPVKRYSSGMYVRLAFAVAAHLEPEILVVDEVLAVGDAEFQKRCLGKMSDVANEGRTVLFVSHNMPAISRLCSRAMRFEKGSIVEMGEANDVIANYLAITNKSVGLRDWNFHSSPGTDQLKLLAVRLLNKQGDPVSVVRLDEELTLQIEYFINEPGLQFRCYASFASGNICAFSTLDPELSVASKIGRRISEVTIYPHLLNEGEYIVGVSIFSSFGLADPYVKIKDVFSFQVVDSSAEGSSRGDFAQNIPGLVRPKLPWKTMLFEGDQ